MEKVFQFLFGKTRLRIHSGKKAGERSAFVLDTEGNVIGDAQDLIYAGHGWAVHTKAVAGYVPEHQIEYVD